MTDTNDYAWMIDSRYGWFRFGRVTVVKRGPKQCKVMPCAASGWGIVVNVKELFATREEALTECERRKADYIDMLRGQIRALESTPLKELDPL